MVKLVNKKPYYYAEHQTRVSKANPSIHPSMDYANNVSEDVDFKMSKIKDEAFLPRWLTTLVNDEVIRQGEAAPSVLNFGGPIFTNTIIEKDGESFYGFGMCNEYTKPDHAPVTVNALNKTVDNYITLRNRVVAQGVPLLDLDNTMKEWYGKVKGMLLADPAGQLVQNLNEKGIPVKTLDDLQHLKGEAFDRFRELDMPNTWIALNPYIKGFKNDFIVPQKFWDFENSYATRIQNKLAEPSPIVENVEEKKSYKPKLKV
jgi:hypothetical protein